MAVWHHTATALRWALNMCPHKAAGTPCASCSPTLPTTRFLAEPNNSLTFSLWVAGCATLGLQFPSECMESRRAQKLLMSRRQLVSV